MSRKGSKIRIFLSHAAADRDSARKVRSAFSHHPDVRVFTAEMLSAGGDWKGKLKKELSESNLFLALLSNQALESNLVMQEIGAAWALGKPVVVVLTNPDIASKVPLDISSQYWVSVRDLNDDEEVRRILELSGRAAEPDEAA